MRSCMQVGTQQSSQAAKSEQILRFSLQRDDIHKFCYAVDVAIQSVLGMR